MKDMLLLIWFLIFVAFGFLVMLRLDEFLKKNRKEIEKDKKKQSEPYCILCSEALAEDAFALALSFCHHHPCAYVVVNDQDKSVYIDLGRERSAEE